MIKIGMIFRPHINEEKWLLGKEEEKTLFISSSPSAVASIVSPLRVWQRATLQFINAKLFIRVKVINSLLHILCNNPNTQKLRVSFPACRIDK
jgi:hypothetical protein